MRNLITLRKYFIWSSNWFCDYHYYRILFNDLKINNYLKSVFYRLKLPTSQFIITRNYNKMYIEFTFFLKSFLRNINDYNHMLFFMKRNKYLLLSNGTLIVNSYFLYKKICHLLVVHFFYDNERYKKNIESQLQLNGSEDSISFNSQAYLVHPFFNKIDWFTNYISQFKLKKHVKTKGNKKNFFSFTNLLNLNKLKLNNLFSKSKLFYSYFYKKNYSIVKVVKNIYYNIISDDQKKYKFILTIVTFVFRSLVNVRWSVIIPIDLEIEANMYEEYIKLIENRGNIAYNPTVKFERIKSGDLYEIDRLNKTVINVNEFKGIQNKASSICEILLLDSNSEHIQLTYGVKCNEVLKELGENVKEYNLIKNKKDIIINMITDPNGSYIFNKYKRIYKNQIALIENINVKELNDNIIRKYYDEDVSSLKKMIKQNDSQEQINIKMIKFYEKRENISPKFEFSKPVEVLDLTKKDKVNLKYINDINFKRKQTRINENINIVNNYLSKIKFLNKIKK